MLALSFLSVICGCATKGTSLPASDYKVVIWEKGKKKEVKSTAKDEQVREAIIQVTEHSDDMLQLIVTDQITKKIQKEKLCLEISLSSPLSTNISEKIVSFSRVLIPINRENNTEAIVIYLGDNKSYYTPPYVSTHGKTDLRNLAELLNIVSLIN
jgi:hypothetical protein